MKKSKTNLFALFTASSMYYDYGTLLLFIASRFFPQCPWPEELEATNLFSLLRASSIRSLLASRSNMAPAIIW